MDFVNPGAAASLGIQEYLMQRRSLDRQDRIDALNAQRTNLEIQQKQEEIKNAQQDRAVKLVERRQAGLMPGDIPDQSLIADSERVGLPLPTKVEDQYTPLPEGDYGPGTPAGSKTIFLGTPQQRMAQQQQDKLVKLQQARSIAAAEPDPLKAAQILADAGDDPSKIRELYDAKKPYEKAAPPIETEDVYNTDPNKGTLTKIGTVKKGDHILPQPPPKPEKPPDDAPQLTPESIRMWAKFVAKNGGQMPALGSGNAARTLRTAIMNKAPLYDAATDTFSDETGGKPNQNPPDLAANQADYKANQKSITDIQPKFDAASAFARTAHMNQQLLTDVLSKVPDTGITGLNMMVRNADKFLGGEDIVQFNAAVKSLNDEYARLISQPNMQGVLSDSARDEMHDILNSNATRGQIMRVLKTLSKEGDNRAQSYTDQLREIRSRISPTASRTSTTTETPDQRKARLLGELTGPR